jgi:hypothetical protein
MAPANWNEFAWNSGALWGPAPAGSQFPHIQRKKTKNNTMKRQFYFPKTVDARPEWFGNYARQLNLLGSGLSLPAPDVASSVADALFLEYASGMWLTTVREFGPSCTSALDALYDLDGSDPFVLPLFTAPGLPAANAPLPAVVAVRSGAL